MEKSADRTLHLERVWTKSVDKLGKKPEKDSSAGALEHEHSSIDPKALSI